MPTLLVSGASGQLGRLVLKHLVAAAPSGTRIIAATRTPAKLEAPAGVEVRRADFDEPASLESAAQGVDYALLISTDALAEAGVRLKQHQAAIAAFVAAGVRHIAYTSLAGADDSSAQMAEDHRETERALREAPVGFTSLRNNLYAEFVVGALSDALRSGSFVHARGHGATAWVHREDCARTAAHALLRLNETNENDEALHDVSGPKAWTTAELLDLVQTISGRTLPSQNISEAELRAGMQNAGLPAHLAGAIASLDAHAAAGHLATTTGNVERLTGQAPAGLEALLRASASALS